MSHVFQPHTKQPLFLLEIRSCYNFTACSLFKKKKKKEKKERKEKSLTCHWRGWDNLSLGLLEESVFLVIEVELPHQKGLKHTEIITDIVKAHTSKQIHWSSHSTLQLTLGSLPVWECIFHFL